MEISMKITGLNSALMLFDEKKVQKAAKMAINDTTKKIRTAADRQIREKFALKAKFIKKMVTITTTATPRRLHAEITARSKALSLKHFQTRQVTNRNGGVAIRQGGRKFDTYQKKSTMQRGLSVKILKNKGFRPVKRGFAIRHSKGGLSYWRRVGHGKWGSMEGTKMMSVITVASMFSQPQVVAAIEKSFNDTWSRRFRHHLDRELLK